MDARPHLSLPLDLARKLLAGRKIILRAPELSVHPLVRITEPDEEFAKESSTMVIPLPQSVAELAQKAFGMPMTILPVTQDILDALCETEREGVYSLDLTRVFSAPAPHEGAADYSVP